MALRKQVPVVSQPAHDEKALSPRQIHEARVIADLRIMHSMVSQLYNHVRDLHDRYSEQDVIRYADQELLTLDIRRNDETYQFFVNLAEQRRK
jgi:hypothetical protein